MREQPRVWWITQSRAYAADKGGSYIWGLSDESRHWPCWPAECLSTFEPGDITLHYSGMLIRDIGLVMGAPTLTVRPSEPEKKTSLGWHLPVRYYPLDEPVHRNDIPLELRVYDLSRGKHAVGRSPFNRIGNVNQGLAFILNEEIAQYLKREFRGRWPVDSPWGLGQD